MSNGSAHPLTVRIENCENGTTRDYEFYVSPIYIGRDSRNDVVLDAPFVSYRHGVIHFDDARVEYKDLGSANGTLVDGRVLDAHMPIGVLPETDMRIVSLRLSCTRLAASSVVERSVANESAAIAQAVQQSSPRTRHKTADADLITVSLAPLEPLVENHRAASADLITELRRLMVMLPPQARPEAILKVLQERPVLAEEPAFRDLAREHGAALRHDNGAVTRLIGEFAEKLLPGTVLSSPREIEDLLQRVATLLATSIRAFVQLRLGHERFCAEMGVHTQVSATPLQRALDDKAVLSLLLNVNSDVNEGVQMLTRAYADLMTHQVALLSGMMEGARNLLDQLGPSELQRRVKASTSGLARALAPLRHLWRAFIERHRELSEEERELSAAVFGERFARAYLEAFLGHSNDPKGGSE